MSVYGPRHVIWTECLATTQDLMKRSEGRCVIEEKGVVFGEKWGQTCWKDEQDRTRWLRKMNS